MKEKDFIKQNQEKWKNFEAKSINPKPDTLAENFTQITADLSYSRTYYPHRSIKLYLNEKASNFFIDIYKSRSSSFRSFVNFWRYEVPCISYLHRFELYIALLVFTVGFLIGVFSFYKDPDFASYMLGPDYIAMTEENIKNGDPMGVYKQGDRFEMFFRIAINNLQVSFFVFILGLFWGIGSLLDMFWESIRLACFMFFFIKRDVGFNSFTSIFMHGAIEISSLIITGAAGFIMGKGLLFPGNYGRFQSFQMSAKRGIKIILSLMPFFLFAAFIEGYITRLTNISPILRLVFVLLCFVFVAFYFFIYPRFVVKKPEAIKYLSPEKVQDIVKEAPNKYGIMKSDEIYNSAITFLLNKSGKFILNAAIVAALLSLTLYYFEKQQIVTNSEIGMSKNFGDFFAWPFTRISFIFDHYKNHFLVAYSIFLLGIPFVFNSVQNSGFNKENLLSYLNLILMTLIFTSLMFFYTSYYALFFFSSSLYFICTYIITSEKRNFFSAILDTFSAIKENFGLYLGVNIVFLFVALIFLLMSFSPLWLYFTMFTGFVFEESENNDVQYYVFTFFVFLIAIYSLFIMYASNVYLYETLKEIKDGQKLKSLIQKLAPIRRS